MSNTSCLVGPPFSISGRSTFTTQQVSFKVVFNSTADENSVKAYQWYLNDELVPAYKAKTFNATLNCGQNILGVRILTTEGWSGIKNVSFPTCAPPTPLVNISWSNVEYSVSPAFIDSNLLIRVEGYEKVREFTTTSGTVPEARVEDTVEVILFGDSSYQWPTNAMGVIEIYQNGGLLFRDSSDNWSPEQILSTSFIVEASSDYEVKAMVFPVATISWSNYDYSVPEVFIDSNLLIRVNSELFVQEFVQNSGILTAFKAGDTIQAVLFGVGGYEWPANGQGKLEIYKNGALLFEVGTSTWAADELLNYSFVVEEGAAYEIKAFTLPD